MNLREALGTGEVRAFMRGVVQEELAGEVDRRVAEALVANGTGAGVRAATEVLETAERDRPRRHSRRGRAVLESMIGPAVPASSSGDAHEGEATKVVEVPSGVVKVPAWEVLMRRRGVSEAAIEATRTPGWAA